MLTPLTRHTQLQTRWLGKAVGYADGMSAMREEMAQLQVVSGGGLSDTPTGQLLLLEHEDTVTITRQGGQAHLRVSPEELQNAGISLVETDRGGDVTFHGPGQLVGYPVLALNQEGTTGRANLTGYLRALESGLLAACVALGIRGAHLKEGMTGIWICSDSGMPPEEARHDDLAEKLIAIGVGVRQGITRHGFALNVTTNLERFTDRIVPCGLQGRGVTSLKKLAAEGRFTPPPAFSWSVDDPRLHAHFARAIAAALGVRLISALSQAPETDCDPDTISQRHSAASGFLSEGESSGSLQDETSSSCPPSSTGEIVSLHSHGTMQSGFFNSAERM